MRASYQYEHAYQGKVAEESGPRVHDLVDIIRWVCLKPPAIVAVIGQSKHPAQLHSVKCYAPFGFGRTMPIERSGVKTLDLAPALTDRAFVVEIGQAMIRQSLGRQCVIFSGLPGGRGKLPCGQGLAVLEHQIMVRRSMAAMKEDDKSSAHGEPLYRHSGGISGFLFIPIPRGGIL